MPKARWSIGPRSGTPVARVRRKPIRPRTATSRLPDALAVLLVLGVVAAHLRFMLLDTRLMEGGSCLKELPWVYRAVAGSGCSADLLYHVLATDGGWYRLGLSLWLFLVGRSSEAIQLVNLFWILLILACSAYIARRLGGSSAALATTALVASLPPVVLLGRAPGSMSRRPRSFASSCLPSCGTRGSEERGPSCWWASAGRWLSACVTPLSSGW